MSYLWKPQKIVFILWAITWRMPEMERAYRKYQIGKDPPLISDETWYAVVPEWILRFLWRTMIRKILDWSV